MSADTVTVQVAHDRKSIDACLEIRRVIFVVEQNVPVAIERDQHDATALHFIARSGAQPIGTARVVLKDNGKTAKIGRVAVLRSHRGTGIGKLLLAAVETSPDLSNVSHFALEAQTHALRFYTSLGYAAHGDEFMDAGIPHRSMKKPGPSYIADKQNP